MTVLYTPTSQPLIPTQAPPLELEKLQQLLVLHQIIGTTTCHNCHCFPALLLPKRFFRQSHTQNQNIANLTEMATLDELAENFLSVNITVSKSILKKCLELCVAYNFDAEEFADEWFAFSASHLAGAPPCLETLDKLERKELQKQNRTATPRPKYKPPPPPAEPQTTPKRPKKAAPVVVQSQSPVVESPKINKENTPSHRYSHRSDSLSVQAQFGTPSEFTSKEGNWNLKLLHNPENCKYMYEKLSHRRLAINRSTQWIGEEISKHHGLELTQEPLKNYSGEMVVCGRICSDASKLNLQSTFLETSIEINKGLMVKLILDNLSKYSVFPGQVIVAKGNNQKKGFVAHEIFTTAPLALPSEPVIFEEPLQIVVASGPFTLPDNLLYDPLKDLIQYILKFKPNIVILIGPFVESTHAALDTLDESYEDFFDSLMTSILNSLQGIKVIIIPSHKDVHGHVVYPTLPYTMKNQENVIFAPSPCLLDIDGLQIAAHSPDILFHISKQEMFCDKNPTGPGDRMARLASHLIHQRSFYPLYPADLDVRIDQQLLEMHGMLESSPHLLIVPSNLRHFVKKIDDCIVLNPERLTKGHVAGTFARVEVRRGSGAVHDRISCEILRV